MNEFQIESGGGDDDKGLSDSEEINDGNLTDVFNIPYHLESEVAVATQRTYILHMDGSVISNPRVAVALSDLTCAVYDVNQLSKLETLKGHTEAISNIKFSTGDEHLIYSSSLDGTIKLWDLRTPKSCVKEFKDDTEESDKFKPLLNFDISCNNRFLCGGTELLDQDSFLLFWDLRSDKLLGGYWESHTDDITQVQYHPTKADHLATASTDGLINIFDEKIGWFEEEGAVDSLYCCTHTEDLQLWTMDGVSPYVQFPRNKISESMQHKSPDNSFIVDVYPTNKQGELLVLASSNAGRGECLRTLSLCKKKLKPLSNLTGNKQIVRASWYNKDSELLVTGGESGILSILEIRT